MDFGGDREASIGQIYPGKDPWIYSVDGGCVWQIGFEVANLRASRPIFRCECEHTGITALLKEDEDADSLDAIREKIAVDLAKILDFNTPAAVLAPQSSLGRDRVCVRDLTPYTFVLKTYVAALTASRSADEAWSALSDAYDRRYVAFDLLVSNSDRESNFGNLLIFQKEDSEAFEIIPIDFARTLGGGHPYPWSQGKYAEIGWKRYHGPCPDFCQLSDDDYAGLEDLCDKVENIPENIIRELVSRAFVFYNMEPQCDAASYIYEGLVFRKGKIKEWLREKLI